MRRICSASILFLFSLGYAGFSLAETTTAEPRKPTESKKPVESKKPPEPKKSAEPKKKPARKVSSVRKCSDQQPPVPKDPEWSNLPGYIWTGVNLYFGPEKTYSGRIMGGTVGSARMVKICGKDGKEEWKSRDALLADENWYVDQKDPALKRKEWRDLVHK